MKRWATNFFADWKQTATTYFVWLRMMWLSHLEYRIDFFFSSLGSVSWVVITLISYKIIFGKVEAIAGWSWEQMLLLYGVYNLWWGLMVSFFSGGLRLSGRVRRGGLDRFILWPGKAWIYASMAFSPATLVHAFSGLAIFFIAPGEFQLILSFSQVVLFLLLLLNSFIIVYFVCLLFGLTSFWFIENNEITQFFWLWETLSKYPPEFFRINNILYLAIYTVIPVAFVAAVPAKVFLGEVDPLTIGGSFIISFFAAFLALKMWRAGLRRYTGVSV